MLDRAISRRTLMKGATGSGLAMTFGWTSGCAPDSPLDPLEGAVRGLPLPTAGRDTFARVPDAFNRRVRSGTTTVPLSLLEGALPASLAGHVFFQSLSLLPTDSGFSGDSLIWRIDFDQPTPQITSRILETTDFHMGEAFADTPLRFESHGMMRLGPLGLLDQANTALVQLDGNRLIATVDGGRPWEVDPATLAPVGPVGWLKDYRPMAELVGFNQFLCPMNITTAHPPYDAETGEYYGVSLSIIPVPGMHYCEVLCWDGAGEIKRVPLLTPDLQPILISQTAHQICVSRDYLVILDASSSIEFTKLAESPHSWASGQTVPPRPDSHFWVIRRDDLRRTTGSAIARRAIVPRESGHFMVDYENEPGRIVIHSPHTSALDFAEWIMPFDVHPNSRTTVRPALVDAITPVNYDIGVVGRYEIEVQTGRVLDQTAFFNDWTWGTGGLTARNPKMAANTGGDVFHCNSGFPTDLAIERVYSGFIPYPQRLVPNEELPWEGVPTSLVRIDHDASRVVDGYFFAGDLFAWTPTFVPHNGTATGGAAGHVVVVVFGDRPGPNSVGTELWIFDASNLAQGPVAKLGRSDLNMPLTLHSVWLDSLHVTRPPSRVDVAKELTERATTWSLDPSVLGILRSEVLPAYERSVV